MNDRFIDFAAMWKKYRRFWWLVLASFILCGVIGWMYLRAKTPEYLVMSTVMVTQESDNKSAGTSAVSMLKSLGGAGGKVDDELVVIGSHELCREMIKELKLNRRYYEKTGFLKKKDHYNTSTV